MVPKSKRWKRRNRQKNYIFYVMNRVAELSTAFNVVYRKHYSIHGCKASSIMYMKVTMIGGIVKHG